MEIQKFFNGKVVLITPKRFYDSRGFFSETYNQKNFEAEGINATFIQDNFSQSIEKYTFRGLHFQSEPMAQAKVGRVLKGSIVEVVVDIRQNSESYLQSMSFELSFKDFNQLYISPGFAHGFLTMEENTEIAYKVTEHYSPEHDVSLRADSPELLLNLPVSWDKMHLSEKDLNGISVTDLSR